MTLYYCRGCGLVYYKKRVNNAYDGFCRVCKNSLQRLDKEEVQDQ